MRKRLMKSNNTGGAIITVIIIALITALIGIYLLIRYGDKIPDYLIPKKISKPEAKTVLLYFSDKDGLMLKAEKREISKRALAKEVEESIKKLIEGSKEKLTPTIPEGTRLLSLEIKDGTAFLNFSREISEKHPGGTSAEIQTIYSVVNTIALNFPEVKKVQFLIEGKKAKTLAGHIDISFPLGPDKEFIKG